MSDNNSYEKSESDLVKPSSGGEDQGSLERGIAGEYDFSIGALIKTAWSETSGFKLTAWGAMLILFLFAGITGAVEATFDDDQTARHVIQFLSFLILCPINAGLYMLGIHRAAKREVKATLLLTYYNQTLKIVGLNILMLILILIGLFLLVLPGIYLSVAYSMAIPLMLEKNLSIWEALESSRKAVTHKWFSFFGLYIVVGLIFILAMIPLFLGLIWVMPMFIVLGGVIYRTVFGIKPVVNSR